MLTLVLLCSNHSSLLARLTQFAQIWFDNSLGLASVLFTLLITSQLDMLIDGVFKHLFDFFLMIDNDLGLFDGVQGLILYLVGG